MTKGVRKDVTLGEIAVLYQHALDVGGPRQYIARKLGISPATAGRRIREARDAGLIPELRRYHSRQEGP